MKFENYWATENSHSSHLWIKIKYCKNWKCMICGIKAHDECVTKYKVAPLKYPCLKSFTEEGNSETNITELASEYLKNRKTFKYKNPSKYCCLCKTDKELKTIELKTETAKGILPPEYLVTSKEENRLQFKTVQTQTPHLLCFISCESGSNEGVKIMNQLQTVLNPRQVIKLTPTLPPRHFLQLMKPLNLRIIVAGGDGSISWVFSELDEIYKDEPYPPIFHIPLGTGNDFSKALGMEEHWNKVKNTKTLIRFLNDVIDGESMVFDRWNVETTLNGEATTVFTHSQTFNNYFSIGIDAGIAYRFTEARQKHNKLLAYRFLNKLCYGFNGLKQAISSKPLNNYIKIMKCNGDDYMTEISSVNTKSLLLLNINSYAGGVPIWNRKHQNKNREFEDMKIHDGRVETMRLKAADVVKVGLMAALPGNCLKAGEGIAQMETFDIKIEPRTITYAQIDGEPILLAPGSLYEFKVTKHPGQAKIIRLSYKTSF